MAYKTVENEEKNQFWFVEETSDGANGPAIAHYKCDGEKRIGVMKDNWFVLNLSIYDEKGSSYCLSKHTENYEKNGPVLLVNNGIAYFGNF